MWRRLSYVCWERWNSWDRFTSLLFGILIAATVFTYLTLPDEPFIALDGSAYNVRQALITTEAEVGGTVLVLAGQKCNISTETIEVVGEITWRRVDILGFNVPGFRGTRTMPPGCTEQLFFENPIPPEITEGTWEITGIETAHYRGRTHTRTWHTEPFTIR